MSERYRVVAGRIRRELNDLERVIARAKRALQAAQQRPEDQDLYLDSVALNLHDFLHDFYAGLERLFSLIASEIDGSLPTVPQWHRALLQQMGADIPSVRPAVLSEAVLRSLEEYLGFRHVVRSIYAFEFDRERLEPLVRRLPPTFQRVREELLTFSDWLEQVAGNSGSASEDE